MTSAPLTLSASSTIDYGAGASEIDFANSSAKTWTGTLNLASWDAIGGTTLLRFGTDATGLTTGQLADIEFGGNPSTVEDRRNRCHPLGYVVMKRPNRRRLASLGFGRCRTPRPSPPQIGLISTSIRF